MEEFPRLRYLEPMVVEQDGEPIALIRDPEELAEGMMAVGLPTLMIMSMFDGRASLRDVQAAATAAFGQLVTLDQLESLVRQLDEQYLLENERTRLRRGDLIREFESSPTRPAAHAGSAYPSDPDEIIAVFDAYFASPEGPLGRPAPAAHPIGLVTPHIDLRCGGPCMARGFHELRTAINPDAPPRLYIILGVAHHPTSNLYTLTTKDFETPLGPARVNQAAAARLAELYGAERLGGEYAHKREHSVEFQTVFLKYLHRDGPDFTILPILCGSLHEELEPSMAAGASPYEREEVRDFTSALATLTEEFGPNLCVIAGVDLSHVGKKFGAEEGVDDFRAGLIRAADMRMLESVVEGDAEKFFDHFRPDRNARNVDAVCAVYTLLHALRPTSGELLGYGQYRERETESLVSYASLALRR